MAGPAPAQATSVTRGDIPSDSFAVLYLMADRYLIPGGSMRKLSAELGYLKYTDFLSADRLFTLTYRDRALKELGRR